MYFGLHGDDTSGNGSAYDNVSAHYRGQIALISNRGPASFVSHLSHNVFSDDRLYLVSDGEEKKKSPT